MLKRINNLKNEYFSRFTDFNNCTTFTIHSFLNLKIHSFYTNFHDVFQRVLFYFTGKTLKKPEKQASLYILPGLLFRENLNPVPNDRLILKYSGVVSNNIPFEYYEAPDHDLAVVNKDTHIIFNFEGKEAIVFLHEKHAKPMNFFVVQCVLIPILSEFLREENVYMIHSSAVSKQGRGIVIVGKGGVGKTTVSIHCVKNGFKFLGDDLVFLSETNEKAVLFSFPIPVHIKFDTLKYFPELDMLSRTPFQNTNEKQFFRVDKIFKDSIIDQASPFLMLFPEFNDNNSHKIEEISRIEAFKRLISNSMYVTNPERSRNHFEILNTIIESVKLYKLKIGKDLKGLSDILSRLAQDG